VIPPKKEILAPSLNLLLHILQRQKPVDIKALVPETLFE
jgi:hypothetical protein